MTLPPPTEAPELPALPEPLAKHPLLYMSEQAFTADQMLAYALQAIAAAKPQMPQMPQEVAEILKWALLHNYPAHMMPLFRWLGAQGIDGKEG